MKRWKKIVLVLLGLLLLSQTPFAYRRYRLGQLRAAIDELNARRVPPAGDGFDEYKGVIHVHSWLGGHSAGGFGEIVQAARANGLSFVVMTEHPAPYVNTAEATLKGFHEGVLFINGSEVTATGEERLFILPGIAPPQATAQGLVTEAKTQGRLAFVAYPEQVRDWGLQGYDGIEIYNLYTNSKEVSYGLLFFDLLWSYWSYPDLLFTTFYAKPEANLKKWDELNASDGSRRLVAIAGNDSHANVGIGLHEQTGEEIFGINLDPYERSFRVVRNHVLVEKGQPLSAETLLAALGRGHSFISFDLLGDAGGFRFTAENASERKVMGDEIALAPGASQGGVRLSVTTPVRGRLVFLRDGQVIHEEREAESKELTVDRQGAYRVEVYLDQLRRPLSEKPWIISNPIYVR